MDARAKPANSDELLFLPLGGAGEIGMNMNLFGYRGRWLMVDCGVTFADEVPGIDVIMPDPGWIVDHVNDLDGLVLTHAHEDHIGAVPYLWERLQCKMWATPFTAAVLKRKLQDVGLDQEARITVLKPGARFKVGSFWDIEMVTLTHSIPEPNALLIRTPAGTIFHTGDWKLDPTPLVGQPVDENQLRGIGDAGVLACVGDSTNVFRAGVAGSEKEVRESLIELTKRYEKRVVIACFASNVARLETVAAVAKATKRHAGLVGRSLWRMYEAAKETGYLRDIAPFISEQEAAELPRERVLMAATGSQGEPRAALSRIAAGTHPHVSLEEGDTVIFSSRIIPGNERAINRLHDALAMLGAEVVTEKDHFVHVSGHPARDELMQMYQWIRPRILVPVHGEARHMMEHAKLGDSMQIPHTIVATNGQMMRLAPGRPEIIDEVPFGRLAVDGTQLIAIDGAVIKERKRMLYNGSAVATVVLDRKGKLVADPQLSLHGLAEEGDERELEDSLVEAIEDALSKLSGNQRGDDGAVEEAAYRAIRRTLMDTKGKKPTTAVHVVRV
jgi:ribonuclease J